MYIAPTPLICLTMYINPQIAPLYSLQGSDLPLFTKSQNNA